MNSNEIKWLKQVKKYPNRFKIIIDNDSIYVVYYIEDEHKFDFESCGVDFMYGLLNHLGYKSVYIVDEEG